jgi:hypothetical protein
MVTNRSTSQLAALMMLKYFSDRYHQKRHGTIVGQIHFSASDSLRYIFRV